MAADAIHGGEGPAVRFDIGPDIGVGRHVALDGDGLIDRHGPELGGLLVVQGRLSEGSQDVLAAIPLELRRQPFQLALVEPDGEDHLGVERFFLWLDAHDQPLGGHLLQSAGDLGQRDRRLDAPVNAGGGLGNGGGLEREFRLLGSEELAQNPDLDAGFGGRKRDGHPVEMLLELAIKSFRFHMYPGGAGARLPTPTAGRRWRTSVCLRGCRARCRKSLGWPSRSRRDRFRPAPCTRRRAPARSCGRLRW